MKKILLIAAAFITGFTAMAQQKADEVLKVNVETYNFGKIKQGTPVTTFFEITNTTNKPLVIENASASCGCTTPEYAKEPISPNGKTKIKVGYNAAALGSFNKDVFIKLAGIQEPKVVKITGEVLDAAAYDAYAKEQQKTSSVSKKAKK